MLWTLKFFPPVGRWHGQKHGWSLNLKEYFLIYFGQCLWESCVWWLSGGYLGSFLYLMLVMFGNILLWICRFIFGLFVLLGFALIIEQLLLVLLVAPSYRLMFKNIMTGYYYAPWILLSKLTWYRSLMLLIGHLL